MMRTPSTLAMRALRRSRRGLAFMPTEMTEGGVIAISEPFKPAVPRDARPFSLKAVPPLLLSLIHI